MSGGGRARAASAPRFHHELWFVAFVLVTIPPLGLVFLVLSPVVSQRWKLAVATLLAILLGLLGALEYGTGAFESALQRVGVTILRRGAHGFLRVDEPERARPLARLAFRFAPADPRNAWANARVAKALDDELARGRWLHAAVRPGLEEARRHPVWVQELGRYHLERGNLLAARRCLEILEKGKGQSRAGANLRAAWLLARRQPVEAEEAARRVIRAFWPPGLAQAYDEIGRARAARGQWRRAAYYALESYRHDVEREQVVERLFEEYLPRAEVPLPPYRAAVTAIRLQGSFGEAFDEEGGEVADALMAHVLVRAPGFDGADLLLHARASRAFYQQEDHEAALALYQRVVEQHTRGETWCRCLVQSAKCLGELERYPEAFRAIRRAEADCPGGLADMARQVGDKLRFKRFREQDD